MYNVNINSKYVAHTGETYLLYKAHVAYGKNLRFSYDNLSLLTEGKRVCDNKAHVA